ncbi:hypothetical protein [Solicola sp. PLA-1-18]|uniref:hypothetical protein n=1 Tax=Solicola sp. PLA-1-18 TaxID=3380532 RepID=UPI003B7AADBF
MSDDPDLTPVQQALTATGVYVDPSMAADVPASVVRELIAEVRGADPAVYVVVYPLDSGDAFNGDGNALARTIVDDGGPAGTYLVAYEDYSGPTVDAVTLGVPEQDLRDSSVPLLARAAADGGLDAQLQEVVPAVVDGTVDRALEQAEEDGRIESYSSGTGSDDGSVVVPAVGGGVLVALVAIAVVVLRRRARRRRQLALPRAVLGRVRAAADRRLATRAETEVLALGEAIDAHEIAPTDDTDAWQAALDHYELARRVMERADGTADVVGAVVLAERGTAALQQADRGAAWEPQKPCYLNPMHGRATTTTRWHDATFPACRACDRDVERGREPDALVVTVGGRSVHYAEADVEPWASTGYGSLDPDLVAALRRRL